MSFPKLKQSSRSPHHLVPEDESDKSEIYARCDSKETAQAIAGRLAWAEKVGAALDMDGKKGGHEGVLEWLDGLEQLLVEWKRMNK